MGISARRNTRYLVRPATGPLAEIERRVQELKEAANAEVRDVFALWSCLNILPGTGVRDIGFLGRRPDGHVRGSSGSS